VAGDGASRLAAQEFTAPPVVTNDPATEVTFFGGAATIRFLDEREYRRIFDSQTI